MRLSPKLLMIVPAVGLLIWSGQLKRPAPLPLPPAPDAGSIPRTFVFTQESTSADQRVFLRAVSAARRPARRLIDLVDGLVHVSFGIAADGNALGTTVPAAERYDLVIDVERIYRAYGQRGVNRVVLHELGHVVDFAFLTPPLRQRLVAEIPRGGRCDPGIQDGGCTAPDERFAETFAKWAEDDIGEGLDIGYSVPPPTVRLHEWGLPLTRLGR